MNKRTFLKKLGLAGISTSPFMRSLEKITAKYDHYSSEELAMNEDYWLEIRSGYRLKPDYINLENGYYCFIPQATLENLIHHIRMVNYEASHYMRTVQWDNKRYMCSQLAELADCDPQEVIITRNTTESLDTVISGISWQEGDEAVMAIQDYGAMRDHFKLQAKRFGMVNKVVSVPNHPKNDAEIVELYANAISEKTKLLMVCHMINITGQILPIRKICDMAHAKGIDVMVDGAHAFGHIHFSMKDLDCDYYGTSLHKWLSVPLGAGMLYVRKNKIKGLWQMFGDMGKEDDDIRKLNHTGTHPVYTDLAIGNALEYHHRIGPKTKEARLRYIQRYWSDQVRDHPNIVLNTPKDPHRSCGIANVGLKNLNPKEMAKELFDKYRIWTVGIDGQNVHGCRISPNIYTTPKELDVFVRALIEMAEV